MKAITCSQCGAIIKNFSLNAEFASCSYCNAKFRMRDVKVEDIPRKEVIRINSLIENYSSDVAKIANKDYTPYKYLIGLFSLIIVIIVGVAWFNGYQRGSLKFGLDQPSIKTTITARTQISLTEYNEGSKAILNFDKLEYPEIFNTDLLNYESNEIIEKIFSEKTINVKVKVDKNGSITEAKAENGHKHLQKACEKAAMKSTFHTPVNEHVTIVYMFSILE